MKTTNIQKSITTSVFFFCLLPTAFGETTFGSPDCGQWTQRKREPDKAWVLGYVSGLNAAGVAFGDKDWLEKVYSAEQIFTFVDNYCQKNPLKRTDSAGKQLMFELTKQ